MRAVVWDGVELAVRDDVTLVAAPGPTDVVVEIHAAGVCHSDLKVVTAATTYPVPVVLGHEGAGRVIEVGDAVRSVSVGDTVVLHTLRFCGRCRACASGYPTQCRNGLGAIGTPFAIGDEPAHQFANTSTFVERTVVGEEQVVRIDASIPSACAALLGCGVLTGAGAVFNRARVGRGDRVVVLGIGGVGLNVVQAAVIAGAAEVVAVDTNAAKEAVAHAFGATAFVPGGDGFEERVRTMLPFGADHVFVCIGNTALVSAGVSLLGPGGQLVVVGFPPPGAIAGIAVQSLYQDKSILACRYGTSSPHRDIPLLAGLYRSGRLKLDELVTQTLPLAHAARAFDDLHHGNTDARTVLVPGA
jgi:S-(hydroxymethyl)glutathione dehydrogenase/alcohol dehydrogenase